MEIVTFSSLLNILFCINFAKMIFPQKFLGLMIGQVAVRNHYLIILSLQYTNFKFLNWLSAF